MNNEIQSYVFFELIKFFIIVFVTLRISNTMNFVVSVISIFFFFIAFELLLVLVCLLFATIAIYSVIASYLFDKYLD